MAGTIATSGDVSAVLYQARMAATLSYAACSAVLSKEGAA